MTWVPPFFTCGECGGEIGRWPMLNLLNQEILDWRHRTVPDAWQDTPHRAVLGTRAHQPRIPGVDDPEEVGVDISLDVEPDSVPPPELPARPALWDDLPRSAQQVSTAAGTNGWETEAWVMRGTLMDARWKASRVRTSVVLRFRRDGHGLVAIWVTDNSGDWKFDEAYSVARSVTPLGSPELKAALRQPRALCETCDEPPALHVSTPTGPVCHAVHVTQRDRGGTP